MEPIKTTLERAEKLEAIYKEMANKELTPWCCVEVKAQNEYGDFTYRLSRWDERPTSEIKEIIGHPVMIGDVIDWIEPYWELFAQSLNLSNERQRKIKFVLVQWHKKREPIEMQSDECIDYVYSLIPSKSME